MSVISMFYGRKRGQILVIKFKKKGSMKLKQNGSVPFLHHAQTGGGGERPVAAMCSGANACSTHWKAVPKR
jgi:hypothetical protein